MVPLLTVLISSSQYDSPTNEAFFDKLNTNKQPYNKIMETFSFQLKQLTWEPR